MEKRLDTLLARKAALEAQYVQADMTVKHGKAIKKQVTAALTEVVWLIKEEEKLP